MDPSKPFGTHYGAVIGLHSIGGPDVGRELIVPNLPMYEVVLKDAAAEEGLRKLEAEKVIGVILAVLSTLQDENAPMTNGVANGAMETLNKQLAEKIGELLASQITDSGNVRLAQAILGKLSE